MPHDDQQIVITGQEVAMICEIEEEQHKQMTNY
jgi:hypothetical protein